MKVKRTVKHWWQTLQVRSGLAILLVAALSVQVIGAVQYIFARDGISKEVKNRARAELHVKNLEIQHEVSSVETAVGNMQWAVERSIAHKDSIYGVLQRVMENNPVLKGCAIAFEPDYFPSEGRWYEPFVGRDSAGLVMRQIGSENHDYLHTEWYTSSLKATGGLWSEPYIDNVGSLTTVCSYTLPIHDKQGATVAVMCCDISLDWLTEKFGLQENMILASREGRILAHPDKTMVMQTTIQEAAQNLNDSMIDSVIKAMLTGDSGNAVVYGNNGKKGYVYYAPVEGATGWSMAVIFSDEEIYKGLHKVGTYLTLFWIFCLLLLTFIIWRTVRNFKKLQAINAEKERIGGELRIASGIQMGMLPKTFPPFSDCDEVEMHGMLVPAKEVGGDLFDFHLRNGKLFFCVGDVSGKGVPASLVMAVSRSLFRTTSSRLDSPDQIMTQMNDAMSEMNESSMFITLFIGVLDLKTGQLSYSNAGHCPPVLINQGITTLALDANIPVGVMPNWQFTLQQTTITPNTLIFLYTDGLTEAENAVHGQFGEQRMNDVLQACASASPRQLVEQMNTTVQHFVDGAQQSDDLTMLAIKFVKHLTH